MHLSPRVLAASPMYSSLTGYVIALEAVDYPTFIVLWVLGPWVS